MLNAQKDMQAFFFVLLKFYQVMIKKTEKANLLYQAKLIWIPLFEILNDPCCIW